MRINCVISVEYTTELGIVVFNKQIPLPFFPREGDKLEFSGESLTDCIVIDSTFCTWSTMAFVSVKTFRDVKAAELMFMMEDNWGLEDYNADLYKLFKGPADPPEQTST